ncbi:MAG: hypothetical protein ABIG08_01155 [bacterium]
MDSIIKIIGWGLLAAGIILISWTLLNTYNIFTGEAEAPEIFKTEELTFSQKETSQDMQVQLKEMIGEQLQGILPVDSMPKLLNLIVSSMLAGLLIFGGTQLSSLGIKLIRK